MRILSCLIFLLIAVPSIYSQSPHGNKLNIDCSNCHEATNWTHIPSNIKFDHNTETPFKLTGQHISVNCSSCHKSLIFSDVKSQCVSCHQDVHQHSLGPDCERCHTPTSWVVSNIKQLHQNGRFPLVGAHLTADCSSCHTGYGNLYFPPVNTSCFSCHSKQYYSTTSPNHVQSNISTNCQDCHSVTSFDWTAQNFDHSFFPLVGGHKIQNCFSCHKQGSNFKGLTPDCYSCHKQNFITAKNPDHVQAKFPTTCADCHNIMSFTPATFNHASTGFALTGAHATVSCASCHTGGYVNTPADCYSCHSKDFAAATDPNHVAQGFPHDCSQCHSTSSWNDAKFDHNTTAFPLTGAHASVSCASCHTSGYKNTPTDCYSCHSNTYVTATTPTNHSAAGLPHTCQDCHSTTSWAASTFNHATTGFTLTGSHVSLDCSSCHIGTVTGLTTDCYSCHSKDFASTTDPNHVAQGFPHDCSQCHSTSSWNDAKFDHNTTAFPLTGAHASVSCASCHTSGYTNTPTDCYSCHSNTYATATTPTNHSAAGLPHTCQDCHTTTSWTASTFNHTNTGFTLTGAHVSLDCSSCHKGTVSGLTADCYSCHAKDYAGTTDPNHTAQGFPHDCTQCHSTTSWSGSSFDHNTTGFPLTGAHTTVSCASCHSSGYTNTPTDCYSCHSNTYTTATTPTNHSAAGLPHTCQDCHSTASWTASTFNHTTTGFTLTGAHVSLDCSSCHKGTVSGLTADCYSCHAKDYTGATDPNHVAQGFPHDCTQCHSTTSWSGATFDHNTTGFPLTGAHTTVACASCHSSGYTNTATACYSCHQTNYQSTSNPSHTALALPTDCSTCHSTDPGWTNAKFTIHSNYYVITGAHTTLSCDNCHNGNYNTAPATCYGCHTTDYNNTNNPPHKSAGYPTDCTQCHTQTTWTPSTFNHTTYFPLSGSHNVSCAKCHTTISNFGIFSCTATCHSQSSTDSNHRGVKNYVYSSTSCYGCHPTGRGG